MMNEDEQFFEVLIFSNVLYIIDYSEILKNENEFSFSFNFCLCGWPDCLFSGVATGRIKRNYYRYSTGINRGGLNGNSKIKVLGL